MIDDRTIREIPRGRCRSWTCGVTGPHPDHSPCTVKRCLDQGLAHMTPHRVEEWL